MDYFEKTEHYGEEEEDHDHDDSFVGKVDYTEEEAEEDSNQILGAADEFMGYDED
ncbi:hypothetical protein SAMN05443574_12419 [Haloarcula vallismortis]|uniref:DUF5786 domain-containing protein n=1 Tax=Haloarcula vallismortis TaxID=28442 RepID=A0A1H3AE07_HALVA|nr:hypothetical protein [Haloarcula vallismortis]SDX27947.1 hypothetical protein SAMN05443574_12419 [Haloarcula vallismortis]